MGVDGAGLGGLFGVCWGEHVAELVGVSVSAGECMVSAWCFQGD